MKRTASARGKLVLVGLGLPISTALGCNAQVGEGYTGEPLLSLRGTVILTEPRSSELVPAIAFEAPWGKALLDVEVHGDFPAEFRLDVTEPPPESVLYQVPPASSETLKGSIGVGTIVVVPRGHERIVPRLTRSSFTTDCSDDGKTCNWEEKACSPDGRCFQQTLLCTDEDCPLIASSGDSAIASGLGISGASSMQCITESCMTAQEWCRPDNECYREIRDCDLSRNSKTTTIYSNGTYHVCEVIAESGDTSLADIEPQSEGGVLGYTLLYVTEQSSLPEVGTLEPGYNLIETIQPSAQAWAAQLNCTFQAAISAVVDYNQAHGTSYTVHERIDDPTATEAIAAEEARLSSECPVAVVSRLLEEPLERSLTMKVGRGQVPNTF